MIDPAKLEYAKRYLRRKFFNDLDGLKELADTVAAALLSGKTRVAITQSNFEGGSAAGQLEFEAAIVGMACEQLITELDDTAPPMPLRKISSTVELGP